MITPKSNGVRPRRAIFFGPMGPASCRDRLATKRMASKTLRPLMGHLRPRSATHERDESSTVSTPGGILVVTTADSRQTGGIFSDLPTQPAHSSVRITKYNANNKGSPYSRHNTRGSAVHATKDVGTKGGVHLLVSQQASTCDRRRRKP